MVDETDKNEDVKEIEADENTESGQNVKHAPQGEVEKEGDLQGTISDEKGPPKKVKLFFSKKIWFAIITFLALSIIGAIIEWTIQTPISKYVEKITGPRVRTLKDQLKIGNNEFVYKAVKDKFHDEPYDEDYLFLYTESTKGFINDLVKEREWDKAKTFLNESLEGMPVPPEHRTALRRTFAQSLPIFFKENHTEYNKKEKKEWIDSFSDYAKSLAIKEKDDPELQYSIGEAIALSAESYYQTGYYRSSLEYFYAFLNKKPKDREIPPLIPKVFMYFLSSDAERESMVEMRKVIVKHLMKEMEEDLHNLLVIEQPKDDNSKRFNSGHKEEYKNAFLILSESGKITDKDRFNYHLMRFLNSDDDDDLMDFKKANDYLTTLKKEKKLAKAIQDANLPEYVPCQIMHNQTDSNRSFYDKDEMEMLNEAKPLLKTSFIKIVAPFCNDQRTLKSNETVIKNCYLLLKPAGLVSKELGSKYNKNIASQRKRKRR